MTEKNKRNWRMNFVLNNEWIGSHEVKNLNKLFNTR
ncbi:MAG: hypothetical protein UZ11_BCD004001526 [Bacteroidetes bacterium OLB11]|nr:MAG: hypothetical protein UZ11_BCD004001526 [Bacteroidetes bacterium OLB11]